MFRLAAAYGAAAFVHIRGASSAGSADREQGLLEAIALSAVSGAGVHVAHINSSGQASAPRMLDIIRDARAHGVDVTTECYPYTAGATRIESFLFDSWMDKPEEEYHKLQWAATGERLTRESFLNYRKQGGLVLIHANTEENVRAAVVDPLTMFASDGFDVRPGSGHPRSAEHQFACAGTLRARADGAVADAGAAQDDVDAGAAHRGARAADAQQGQAAAGCGCRHRRVRLRRASSIAPPTRSRPFTPRECDTSSSRDTSSCATDGSSKAQRRDVRFGRRALARVAHGECGTGPDRAWRRSAPGGRKPPEISPSSLECRCRCAGALRGVPALARVAGQERHLTAKGISTGGRIQEALPRSPASTRHSRCIWHRRAESSVWLSRAANPVRMPLAPATEAGPWAGDVRHFRNGRAQELYAGPRLSAHAGIAVGRTCGESPQQRGCCARSLLDERSSDSIAIKLGVAAALLLLAVIAAMSLVRMNRFADGAQWVNHTHEVIEGLDAVLMAITDAEAGQRGFLLTADESYLAPYHASRAALAAKIGARKKAHRDNADQSRRIAQVEALIARRIELLEEGIRRVERHRALCGSAPSISLTAAMSWRTSAPTVGSMKSEELQLLQATLGGVRARSRHGQAHHHRRQRRCAGTADHELRRRAARECRQRKEAELRARRYALEVEDLYNTAPCGYHSLDAEGVIVRINDTELAWLGYTRDEVINRKRLGGAAVAGEPRAVRAELREIQADGVAHDLEYDMVRKDGSTLPVAISATLVRDAAGGYLMSRSTLFDITERKRADQELHETNAFLDSVLEHIPSMIFVKDARELRYRSFEPRRGAIARRCHAADVLGKNDQEVFTLEQADPLRRAGSRGVELRAHARTSRRTCCRRAPASAFCTRASCRSTTGPGSPRYLLGISEDVTERRLAERKIGELNGALELRAQQLEATNKELESFSYSVSHDLRSPLRAIDGFSRILEEDHAASLDEEGMRLLSVIRDNTRRMAQLIDDLLELLASGAAGDRSARRENGCARPREHGSSCAAASAPRACSSIWTRCPMRSATRCCCGRSGPTCCPMRSSTAVPASSRWWKCPHTPERGHMVYCVRDNGVGFDMRYGDKLFGVFQRLHSMDEFPGTGVGLAIVKRVVTRHGGRVWAEAVPDRGAQFYFSLPERRNG